MASSLYDDHAWLYDAAFDWNVEEEADWLVERFGPDARRILEPGCGSGRIFPGLVRRGLEIVGVDLSSAMLARAGARMRGLGLPVPRLVRADMADFDLEETFDGAVCPINTIKYLESGDATLRHLECVARHLRPGAPYLVMSDLLPRESPESGSDSWEVNHPSGGGRIRCTWSCGKVDWNRRVGTERTRFEVLDGPEAGRAWEFTSEMGLWDWPAWRDLIAASPFEQTAAWDGDERGQPRLEIGPDLERERLTWHELRL